ncbi:unnamed protein product [Rhodiola kirilowii]
MVFTQLLEKQPPCTKSMPNAAANEELENCPEILHGLSKERGWRTQHLYKYQNFWCQPQQIQAIVTLQNHFQARQGDIILATIPKSGTTWLKALTFAITNRNRFEPTSKVHPLLTSNPHDLVPFLEYKLYANNQRPDLSCMSSPRIFATHIPYPSLPESIKFTSGCKIVYLCRNPFDTFVSSWHFITSNNVRSKDTNKLTIEEAFDMFCEGVVGFGPFWEHMLGYWKMSLSHPEDVMFLKYEDMQDDIQYYTIKLAKFLGFPFSTEARMTGIIKGITQICSFDNLKDLEVNKKGKSIAEFENKTLFRKGKVGDWVNYLSPTMVEKMYMVIENKLGGSGLTFKV